MYLPTKLFKILPKLKTLVGIGLVLSFVLMIASPAMAAFDLGQVPTVLKVDSTSVRFGENTVLQAHLTRLDDGQSIQSAQINFYIGNATFPYVRSGTNAATNTKGVATVSFRAVKNNVSGSGRFAVVAEYLGDGRFSAALPDASLNVSR